MVTEENLEFKIQDKRKLRKVNSTFQISLPKIWVEGNRLRIGDTLFLTVEKDGSLLVSLTKSGE